MSQLEYGGLYRIFNYLGRFLISWQPTPPIAVCQSGIKGESRILNSLSRMAPVKSQNGVCNPQFISEKALAVEWKFELIGPCRNFIQARPQPQLHSP